MPSGYDDGGAGRRIGAGVLGQADHPLHASSVTTVAGGSLVMLGPLRNLDLMTAYRVTEALVAGEPEGLY